MKRNCGTATLYELNAAWYTCICGDVLLYAYDCKYCCGTYQDAKTLRRNVNEREGDRRGDTSQKETLFVSVCVKRVGCN